MDFALQTEKTENPLLYKYKVVNCGKITEIFKKIANQSRPPKGSSNRNPLAPRKSESILRSKRMLRWISQANSERSRSYFFTATFAEDIHARKEYDENGNETAQSIETTNEQYNIALKRWQKFRRLLLKEYPYVRYIAVPEVQPRSGRWHFHALLVGLPRLSDMRTIYGTKENKQGEVSHAWQSHFTEMWTKANNGKETYRAEIQKAKSIGGVCGYLSKYISKSIGGVVPFGRRNYYAGGKNLKKPIITEHKEIPQIFKNKNASYTSQYLDRNGNLTEFSRYRL